MKAVGAEESGARPGVAVALGANLGDRRGALQGALAALEGRFGLSAVSQVYATEAVGAGVTGEFLNLCASIRRAPGPRRLLEALMELEARAGRPPAGSGRRGDRPLDADLLLYGERRIEEPGLAVPHPRMCERAFVMIPLAEVGPEWIVPGRGRSVTSLASELGGSGLRALGPAGEVLGGEGGSRPGEPTARAGLPAPGAAAGRSGGRG